MDDDPPLVLELIELELYLSSADLIGSGFYKALTDALDAIRGTLLFSTRTEGDTLHQRYAAVVVGDGEHGAVGLVFLSSDGLKVTVEDAAEGGRHTRRGI